MNPSKIKYDGDKYQPTILFLHIPKAAGQTLFRIIERQYEPNEIFVLPAPRGESFEKFLQLPENEKRQLRVVMGHFGFGLHQHIPQPTSSITLLREPVERVISGFYYILRTPEHTHHRTLVQGELNLHDYIEQRVSKIGIDNGQTRFLSGAEDAGDTIPFGACTVELLEKAKENLRTHFSVVGLTERFDETLMLLKKTFGWRFPAYTRENVGTNRIAKADVAPEALQLITEHNQLDLELYSYAQQLFQAQLRRQNTWFNAEVQAFRLLNNWRVGRKIARKLHLI